MLFYKDTTSYKLVTLLEKFRIENKKFNVIKYLFDLYKFKFIINRKFKKSISHRERLDIFIKLYKDRIFLQQFVDADYIEDDSLNLSYSIIDNNLLSEISFNNIIIKVDFNTDWQYSIHVSSENGSFNLDINTLKINTFNDIFKDIFYILAYDVYILLLKIFEESIRRELKAR